MNDLMINLFIPRTQDGSAAAIASHIYAKEHGGAVSIVRYEDEDELNKTVGELMRHITVADGYDAPQPKQRLVWIVGGRVNKMIHDELRWFAHHKPGRSYTQTLNGSYLLWDLDDLRSLRRFFYHLSVKDEAGKNIQFLYNMLDVDEFEHLMAYLLQEHPTAEDVTKEDYVLNLFVEHEKKRRESYI